MTPYPYVGKVDPTLCQVQATFITVRLIIIPVSFPFCNYNVSLQVFTIGSWIHYGALAIETHYLIRKTTNSLRVQTHYDPNAVFWRHFPYHLIITLHGVGVTIWMLQTKTYGFLGMLL